MSDTHPNPDAPHRPHLRAQKELALAARRFFAAAEQQPSLKLLLLLDPIQAMADSGISLSKRARKLLRHSHPEAAYGNSRLYDGVKDGSIRLPWIEGVELGTPADFDTGLEADAERPTAKEAL